MAKPKPSPPFAYMGLGASTNKRFFYDNSFWVKIVCTPPSKNHKQKVGSSLSHRLLLWAPPQVERGGGMQNRMRCASSVSYSDLPSDLSAARHESKRAVCVGDDTAGQGPKD